jgi:hypothetical protein
MTWGPRVTLPPTLTAQELAEAMEAAKGKRHMRRLGLLAFVLLLCLGLNECSQIGEAMRDSAMVCLPSRRD